MYIPISDMQVEATEFTHAGHTCPGAMGYSFAAGTTDGERQRPAATAGIDETRPWEGVMQPLMGLWGVPDRQRGTIS